MKKIFQIILIMSLMPGYLALESCRREVHIKALLLTGQNANWNRNYVALSTILRNTGIFEVEIRVSPPAGQDMSGFLVDFTPYDVVVLDYAGDPWPQQTRDNFVRYVREGGGVVVYHADNNAFPDWPEYNEMIGIGGFGNRDEKSGPYVYVKDGRVVTDDTPGKAGSHGYMHEFKVRAIKPEHPILRGLPVTWMHGPDELYDRLRGPAKNLEVLAFAHSDTAMLGSGRDEPVLMTIRYGKGRVFHTTLGHTWEELFSAPLECAGFITTFQRGTEWAATGKVTQKVPDEFPDSTKSVRWEFYEYVSKDMASLANKMQVYTTGKSTGCFTIFQKIIRDDIKNPDKLREYNRIIRELLGSGATSIDCKKLLLRDFAWMSDESMTPVYEILARDSVLATDALYALQLTHTRQ
jgi:type 1 glutamine amidotransferase